MEENETNRIKIIAALSDFNETISNFQQTINNKIQILKNSYIHKMSNNVENDEKMANNIQHIQLKCNRLDIVFQKLLLKIEYQKTNYIEKITRKKLLNKIMCNIIYSQNLMDKKYQQKITELEEKCNFLLKKLNSKNQEKKKKCNQTESENTCNKTHSCIVNVKTIKKKKEKCTKKNLNHPTPRNQISEIENELTQIKRKYKSLQNRGKELDRQHYLRKKINEPQKYVSYKIKYENCENTNTRSISMAPNQ
ncbi:hypothetical protein A3Q56_03454 [Intoshia linei]|uniref:Uncharacterized protein n=1 Tax=Intoshia linei TaxID=1819745 RepID=A0A177B3K3_9BILA|nr:hypothetical protein A3Q56_03454 [Intoshia linei]